MEMSQQSLFLVVVVGCLLALAAWSALCWTVVALSRWYLMRRLQQRVAQEGIPVRPVAPPGAEAWKVMEAHADLSLAALDVPATVTHRGAEDPLLLAMNTTPWLRPLIGAAQQYKRVLPERNQQMMRAERRAKAESVKYVGDE